MGSLVQSTSQISPGMVQLWLLALLLGVTSSLKHLEQREIKTSDGQIFNCFYTINYNAKGVVNKKKTTVTCNPNKNGGTAIEVFDLAKVGKISLKHSVKKGKEVVQDFSPYTAPSTSSVMPMNCSCKVPFPTEMMEMMGPGPIVPAGRRLAPMLMRHDTENNRKILKVDRGLNRIGPLLLLLLLPQIIAAIQAALAGRSLAVDKEELADKFTRQLFGGGLGSGALLGALAGGNAPANNPADLLGGLTGGNAGGLLGGLTGGNAGGNVGGLLGGLTGGNAGGNVGDNVGGLLGGLTGGTGGNAGDIGGLLGGLTGGTGGGGNPGELLGLLTSLGNGGNPGDLLSNPLVQQMIQQVIQQQLQEFLDNGGPEQVIGEMMAMSDDEMMAMIMPFIPADMQGAFQQFAQMSDEEFMQHLMEQMGMNGGLEEMLGGLGIGGGMDFNMTDIIQEWEAPFDVYCDCIPTDEEHGTMNG